MYLPQNFNNYIVFPIVKKCISSLISWLYWSIKSNLRQKAIFLIYTSAPSLNLVSVCWCVHVHASISMCKSMCRCKCTCRPKCTCMKRQRYIWAITPHVLITLVWGFSPWHGKGQVGFLAMESIRSASLSFPNASVTSTYYHTQHFVLFCFSMGSGEWNSSLMVVKQALYHLSYHPTP